MKRKLLITILVVISCIFCTFGIAACNGDKPNGDGQGTIQTPPEEKPDDKDEPSDVLVTGVTLSKTTLSLEVGDNETLTATVSPNNATDKTVTWKSSDSSVAKVENGKVSALKAGTATITATVGGKSATCKVTVTEKAIAVTGVTLSKTTLSLEVGDNETLTATVAPNNATDKTVTWKSSDNIVAKVENGKITALNAGTATITATAGGKSATCNVTVTEKVIVVTAVTLNKDTLSLEVGENETLNATVAPNNATDKTVTWKSSDSSVAKVENGKVTALKAGAATITATAGGKSATCKVTVTEKVIAVTGVTLNKDTLSLEVGENETLTATIAPTNATDKTVTWKSSDNTVAKVENGKVTALKVGEATITATVGSKGVTCNITVSNREFKGLVFVDETFTYDGTEKNLVVTNLPLGAEVVYDGNGKINAGTYTVKATVSMRDYQSIVLKANLIIEKKELTIAFNGEINLTYTGTEQKTISAVATNLVGNDEINISISYSGEMTEAGNYIATATIAENKNYKLTEDNTIEIVITRAEHSLTFRQQGFEDKVFKVLDLSAFTDIPDPESVEGYDVNWEEIDFSCVRSDLIVNAILSPIDFNITYNLNGGILEKENPSKYNIESESFTLLNPTIEGYTFVGWTGTDIQGSMNSVTITTGNTGDRHYVAKFIPKEYKIAYVLNGGQNESTNPDKYTIEDESITLNRPIKKGYTFAGWTGTDLSEKTVNVTISNGSMGDREYTANWNLNSYKITYQLNSGTNNILNPVSYTIENADIDLLNPQKEHYNFVRWECDNIAINKIAVEQTKDLVIVAIWDAIEYDISYELDGGTAINPIKHTAESDNIVLNEPTRNGYTFLGWTGSNNDVPEKEVIISAGTCGNLNYTANWSLSTYSISYELDGGSNPIKNPTTYSITDTIELKEASKTGYLFNGWFTDSEFTDNVSSLYGRFGDLTLYAKFTPYSYSSIFYTGTYKINLVYWENSELNKTIELTNGETFSPYSVEKPIRSGYIFQGWFLDAAFNMPFTKNITINEDLSIYAKWISSTNPELTTEGVTVSAKQTYTYSSNLKKYCLDKSNKTSTYVFCVPFNYVGSSNISYSISFEENTAGAYVVYANASIEVVQLGIMRTILEYKTSSYDGLEFSKTISVAFIPGQSYMITCIANGALQTVNAKSATDAYASVKISNVSLLNNKQTIKTPVAQEIEQIYDVKTSVPTVSWRGYDFTGWYDETNTLITDVWNYTSDKVFNAGWKLHDYSISYNLNGGINHYKNPATYNLESATITLQNPVKTGYTFDGWYTDAGFTNSITIINATDCCDYTLYAKWIANIYTATLDYDGGQNCPTINFYSKGELIKTQDLYKDSTLSYYVPNSLVATEVFGGWYKDSDFTIAYDFSGIVNSSINLYAKWVDVTEINYVNLGSEVEVTISGNTYQYIAIVLPTAQTITISSSSGLDLYGEIYDSNWNLLASSDDISDTNLDFSITLTMQQGQIYHIGYKANQASVNGSAIISVSGTNEPLNFITGDYTEVVETIDVTYDSPISLPHPKKEGYVFAGWYDESGNSVDTSSWKYAGNVTLYAQWTA